MKRELTKEAYIMTLKKLGDKRTDDELKKWMSYE